MVKPSALFALLEAQDDPTQRSWNETVDRVIKDPKLISGLTDDGVRDDFLILLTTHSHRLALFFDLLWSFARQNSRSVATSSIAAETVVSLISILPDIHQLLEPTKILKFLIPALDVCFVPTPGPNLRELGSVLTGAGSLLEHISCDGHGIEIVRQWVAMKGSIAAGALSLWTERLVTMMHNCGIDHDIALEAEQWYMLNALKSSLQDMDHSTSTSSDQQLLPTTHHELPVLGTMTQLRKEDKKARTAKRENVKAISPQIGDHLKGLLKAFDLQIPGSMSQLLNIINCLEGEKTTNILYLLTSKPPCYLCISLLGSLSQTSKGETYKETFRVASGSHIETLSKGLGLWKVLLSPQALKSVLHMRSHGLVGPVTEKLTEIASGYWNFQSQPRAGLQAQRKCLKVPVWTTSCGQNHFILWQIVIGTNMETEAQQQDITVWEVCDYSEISKILDRVIYLQRGYPDEIIRRCLKHSSTLDGVQTPTYFADCPAPSTNSTRPSADLDIRTVDQSIIEMTNKFYALTAPVIRSILSNDLSAEFPFDLSGEEARVIRHFKTASLILGRSGTGKTTCLVFKLVGKFLASKAIADERPVRQVLLTRSPFLADKLNLYTRRLIETLSSRSGEMESPPSSRHTLSNTAEEDLRDRTVFSLRDTSFPLVCTWDGFLRILENTAAKTGSPVFHELTEPSDQRSDEVTSRRRSAYGQLIDFYAFKADYWPHFPHALTKNLPVHLAFAEIMGVIKGSTASRESLEPLRREEYLAQSCRLAPTFVLEAERSRVYEVFKRYEKLKSELGGVDYVDRVFNLLRALQRDSSLKQLLRYGFDEVYIDEIQDQRCLDIELLLSFIKDCRGFHFAGDTAQAISQESTFRFSDIKALFYDHFARASVATNQYELSHPEMFTLSKNYRSHQGILALASLVMGMIWKGFPETVDKLEPEIGNLNGPKPVLFYGIDDEILRSRGVGQPAVPREFGAEQAILVRDTRAKASLVKQIGEVANILTILESKGMEFEDVILWNFFSECPDQAGLRSLEALDKEPGSFDSSKNSGMCSELKHLYVAITRARVQLFIMESSGTTATTVLKFLGNQTSGSLIHVTSPSQEDFLMRLEMLRPGTSLDPRQWSRRGVEYMHRAQYKDAIRCFRKAQDICGETTAQGHQQEEEARRCNAENNIEGFTQNLTLALESFEKVNLVNDAARVLVALGRPEDAAETLFQDKKYSKAASLFVDAGLSSKAIDCHHLAGEYSEAAAILNREKRYDRLVSYLDENRGDIPASTLQGYSLLCKLLLKQNKTSTEYRKYAVRLLGSSTEQEKCFLEYGMGDELAGLYASHSRYKDLFRFYSGNGQLEQALSLATSHDLLQSSVGSLEPEVLDLVDYVWMGHLENNRLQTAAPLSLPSRYLTPNVVLRVQQWEAINTLYSLDGFIEGHRIAGMESTVPKTVLCLRKILNGTSIARATNLDDLPLEMMQEVILFVRALTLDKNGDALKTVSLLTGLWKPRNGKERFIVLPWSPIRKILTDVGRADPTGIIVKQVLDRLVPAILALDMRARILWKEKWPIRCVQFMTFGCPGTRNGQECHRLHQNVNADDCGRLLGDLLQINRAFCEMAVLHFRLSLNEAFHKNYLGIKRHWLERLSRELIYLSSVEQQTGTIVRSQTELFGNKRFSTVSYFLEVLLYFRLKTEWEKRSNFTSLVEHLQLAEAFGLSVQQRHFRALSHRLHDYQRPLLQRHLSLLYALKANVGRWNASFFQGHFITFLDNLENIEIPALATFHSLTAIFEYFAVHLILRLCTTACVVPNSWIDLHTTSTSKTMHTPEPLQGDDKYRYQGCLIHLAMSFCRILTRMNQAALPRDFLVCSGNTHLSLLLRHRNAELVAILAANMAAASPQPPIGFNAFWNWAQQVFELDFVRASHLKCRTPDDLAPKLAPSLAKHNEKNVLVVVVKDRKKGPVFLNLEGQPGVKTVPFDHLFPPAPTIAAAAVPPTEQNAPPTSADAEEGTHGQYSPAETEALIQIQRRWRSVHLKIQRRRSYVSIPECRAITHFFNLGAQCRISVNHKADRKAIRKLLLSEVVASSLRLDAAKALLSTLQEDTMTCIEKVVIREGVDKAVDDILCRNRDVETLTEKAEGIISDESIQGLVTAGDAAVLEKTMKDVEDMIVEAEQIMSETRKMIEAVSHDCTQGPV